MRSAPSPDDCWRGGGPYLADIQEVICEAAAALDVAGWTLRGVHAWPVMRATVYGTLDRALRDAYARVGSSPPDAARMTHRARCRSRSARLIPLCGAVLFDGRSHSAAQPVLLHQRPEDHAGPDRLMDPLAVALAADGVPAVKLCRFEPHVGLADDAIGYRLGAVSVGPDPDARELHDFLTRARCLLDLLAARGLESGETPLNLLRRMEEMLSRTRCAATVLRHLSPRLLVVHRYHHPDQMPMVVAARTLGIPCVDIQHGYADSCTPSNDFQEAPADGYVGVPDVLWAWSAQTARRLDTDFPPHRCRPRVMVGGAPWLWNKRAPPVAASVPGRSPVVLVAHQPDMILDALSGDLLPAALLDAMEVGGTRLRWVVRLHPTCLHLSAAVRAGMRRRGLGECAEVVAAACPWSASARRVDVVVTGYSALGLEARASNLPVVVLGRSGARVLAPVLAEAGLRTAEDAEGLLASIDAALGGAAGCWSFIDPMPAAVAVRTLLQAAEGGP